LGTTIPGAWQSPGDDLAMATPPIWAGSRACEGVDWTA
jgi:hypothetical protein